jgi:hypothetical protein
VRTAHRPREQVLEVKQRKEECEKERVVRQDEVKVLQERSVGPERSRPLCRRFGAGRGRCIPVKDTGRAGLPRALGCALVADGRLCSVRPHSSDAATWSTPR